METSCVAWEDYVKRCHSLKAAQPWLNEKYNKIVNAAEQTVEIILKWWNGKDPNFFWTSIHPEYWSEHNVCEWLQFCCDPDKSDANCISFPHFNINGLQLCNMTREEFLEAAGICGISYFTDTEVTKPSNEDYLENSHLWEFVRDLLLSPEENSGILKWEDRGQGIFRIVKSEALAKMWGKRKKNDRMTYEKLSRALHYYYKTGILERADRRLVYKFGKHGHGWQENKM